MEQDNRWHLNRGISITHIITTLTVAAGLLIWGLRMEGRVELLEVAEIAATKSRFNIEARLKEADQTIKTDMLTLRREVREDLREINEKLDRLLFNSGRQSGMSGMGER